MRLICRDSRKEMNKMYWFQKFNKKEELIKKSTEIEGTLYDELKEIASTKLEASVNKIIEACIEDFNIDKKIIIYQKPKNEISVARSIIIRESMYEKLDNMRKEYGISITKLINVAIKEGLDKYYEYMKNNLKY